MADTQSGTDGVWAFLPYALTVLGAAIGIFHATSGSGSANPLVWCVIGAVAGRLLALGLARLGDATGLRR